MKKRYILDVDLNPHDFDEKIIHFVILQRQFKAASDFLANEMGQTVNRASKEKIPINLTKDEIQLYIKRFQIIDKDRKGYVSINDIRRGLKVSKFASDNGRKIVLSNDSGLRGFLSLFNELSST